MHAVHSIRSASVSTGCSQNGPPSGTWRPGHVAGKPIAVGGKSSLPPLPAIGASARRDHRVVAELVGAAAGFADGRDALGVGLGDAERGLACGGALGRGAVGTKVGVLAGGAGIPALAELLLLREREARGRGADRALALVERLSRVRRRERAVRDRARLLDGGAADAGDARGDVAAVADRGRALGRGRALKARADQRPAETGRRLLVGEVAAAGLVVAAARLGDALRELARGARDLGRGGRVRTRAGRGLLHDGLIAAFDRLGLRGEELRRLLRDDALALGGAAGDRLLGVRRGRRRAGGARRRS